LAKSLNNVGWIEFVHFHLKINEYLFYMIFWYHW